MPRNWKEKLKWVCFILVLANFSFDSLGVYMGRKPLAVGSIISYTSTGRETSVLLELHKGAIYDGQYIKVEDSYDIIKRVLAKDDEHNTVLVQLEDSKLTFTPGTAFKVLSNIWVVNVSLLFELILTFLIFFLIFRNFPPWNKVALIAMAVTVVWWIIRNLVMYNIHTHGVYFNGTTALIIICFAILYFYYQLTNTEDLFVYYNTAFWIVSSVMLFRAGTLFLFLYVNTLDQSEKANFYTINSGFYILQNLLFGIGFLMKPNKPLSKKPKTQNLYQT